MNYIEDSLESLHLPTSFPPFDIAFTAIPLSVASNAAALSTQDKCGKKDVQLTVS